MKYDAFISYRHAPLDMEMAKKVHTGLETYKIPKAVRTKTGKKKMGRVFRDQEELPIGSDLDDNISAALSESEYLIVICSPRTPDSYWVCKEIETFIKMHDRNHVLAVLIEGEPDESFPAQLLTDENGNPVEPLAADIRGNKKERNSKFKTEILRLAAPVIGCTYDDLKQRHRERVIRRIVTTVSAGAAAIAVAGTAFGIYNANVAQRMKQLADEKAKLADEKTRLADEIMFQFKGKQENQSRFFAEESLSLLNSGNREDAILMALEALPSQNNDRPYVPEAEYALSRALYAYNNDNNVTFDRNLNHSLPVTNMIKTEDESKIVTIDSGNRVYVWDVKTWSLLVVIEPTVDESNYYNSVRSADDNSDGVYVATEKDLTKYDYNGNVLYSKKYEDSIRQCVASESKNKIIVVCRKSINVLDSGSGSEISVFENDTEDVYMDNGRYYKDQGIFAVAHFAVDANSAYLSILNLKDDSITHMKLSEGYYLDSCRTEEGNYAVISCNNDLMQDGLKHAFVDLFDTNGNKLWSKELDVHVKFILSFVTKIRSHSYEEEGETKSDIVVTLEAEAFDIDEKTGEMKSAFNLPGDATMLALSTGSSYGRVGYKQGGIDFVDFKEGRIYSEYRFETNDSVKDAVLFSDMIVFDSYSSPDVHIVKWHDAPDIEDFYTYETRMLPQAVSTDGNYFALKPDNEYTKIYFSDSEGNQLYLFDKGDFIDKAWLMPDKAYVHDRTKLWKIDPFNKTEKEIKIAGIDDYFTSFDAYLTKDASKAVLWGYKDIYVVDLNTEKLIYTYSSKNIIGKAILSDDGKRIYVSEGIENLYVIDIEQNKRIEFTNKELLAVANSYDEEFIALSPDNKYIAFSCEDGFVRVLDTNTMEDYAQIPFPSYLYAFIAFTDDSRYVVMQGDDYRVRIWDIETKNFISTQDIYSQVDFIVCDDESGLMAVCTGYGLMLYETGSYGCVAMVDDGLVYLKNNDSVLISRNRAEIKRTYYKDYKALTEEARKQFPEAKLSEEKKVKYNVN